MSVSGPTPEDVELVRLEVAQGEMAGMGRAWRSVARFSVRVFRILVGLALLAAGLASAGQAIDLLAVPFAAQSIIGILGGLFFGWLALCLVLLAFTSAFGEGPTPEEEFSRQQEEARRLMLYRAQQALSTEASARQKEAMRNAGRAVGQLFKRK